MRVLAVTLCLFAVGCKKSEDAATSGPKTSAPTIKTATLVAAEAPTPDVLVLTGTIVADQRAEVTADTQGKVINVLIQRGDHVKLGQPVIQLDVRTAQMSAREAQAALQSARVSKQLADDECARTKALLDKGAITKSEFDRQNTQCLNAIEQVAQAQARTDMMSKSVADGMVRAPFEGVVSEKNVSPGEWVQPGKPLFTLVDNDPLKIELSIPEKAVSWVKTDQHVDVTAVAHPEKTYGATITRLGAEVGRSRALIAEATLEKSDLVPGMFAEAHITVDHTARIVLPETAVKQIGKTFHAFVVGKDNVVEDRIVQKGESTEPGKVTIVQGIKTGERIVAAPPENMVDGAKVTE